MEMVETFSSTFSLATTTVQHASSNNCAKTAGV
jgi:hypothetical protein